MRSNLIFRFLCIILFLEFAFFVNFPADASDKNLNDKLSIDSDHIEHAKKPVITVTDLGDYLPGQKVKGTLRAVLEEALPGSRIVFARAGSIELKSPLDISVPSLFIDGRSNPLVIYGDVVRVSASGITISHLWLFAGDAPPSSRQALVKGHSAAQERDALVILGPESDSASAVSKITIDHCWIGFGVDECFSTYGKVREVTVVKSFIGYGLNRSIHPKDFDSKHPEAPGHSKGVLVGVGAAHIRFAENVLLHNFDRNILVRGGTEAVQFMRNIVYNWGRSNTFYAGDGNAHSSGVFAGNIYIQGEDSASKVSTFRAASPVTEAGYQIYGNIGPVPAATLLSDLALYQVALQERQKDVAALETLISSPDSLRQLLATVGPHPGLNDRLSALALTQIIERSGGVIDYFNQAHNPAASRGLGFLPLLKELVDPLKLNNYKFSQEGRRTVPLLSH
jgi:hypothetical protein